MDAFTQDLDELQNRLRRAVGFQDVKYIRNCEIAGRLCTLAGFATAWFVINPNFHRTHRVGQVARWALAHHILHRAFDGIEGVPNRFKGSHFARGWRRMIDWNEWMLPAGFQHEHNVHHVYTGAGQDPDVVEANVEYIRTSKQPRWVKYLMALAVALTWRFTYYAPGTFIQLRRRQKGLRSTRYKFTACSCLLTSIIRHRAKAFVSGGCAFCQPSFPIRDHPCIVSYTGPSCGIECSPVRGRGRNADEFLYVHSDRIEPYRRRYFSV